MNFCYLRLIGFVSGRFNNFFQKKIHNDFLTALVWDFMGRNLDVISLISTENTFISNVEDGLWICYSYRISSLKHHMANLGDKGLIWII